MKKMLTDYIDRKPFLLLFHQLFVSKIPTLKTDLQSLHDEFRLVDQDQSIALDMGCGSSPSNRFSASECFGVDLVESKKNKVIKCALGFDSLPFPDDYFDYLTAYDLIEHIPRYSDNAPNKTPFIFFMNECFRILKPNGVFLSMTPIYPFFGAFQDPTHNNIITKETISAYFSDRKCDIAKHYGITASFKILDQKMYGQHLIVVLSK